MEKKRGQKTESALSDAPLQNQQILQGANQRWIDAHVHLFTSENNTPDFYSMATKSAPPLGAVVVHFSKAPDSTHVIDVLDKAKTAFPLAGVIKADIIDPRTFDWILREDVKAVRIYARESVPEFAKDKAAWDRLFNLIRSQKKHVLVFGIAPYLRETIAHIPQDLILAIDHLGLPDAAKGANDFEWNALLCEMKSRNQNAGKVYFKGPGYRTHLDSKKVQPFIEKIIATLGEDRLMLGASDAPYAGMPPHIDFAWIWAYLQHLSQRHAEKILFSNAAQLYGLTA